MGLFSWKTSDTNHGIKHVCSGKKQKCVYMLSPTGTEHVKECAYDGYGRFGGINPGIHIFNINIRTEEEKKQEEDDEMFYEGHKDLLKLRETMGYALLENEDIFKDKDTGVMYSFHYPFVDMGVNKFTGNFSIKQEGYDNPPNELIGSGQWIEVGARDLWMKDKPFNTLKFSYKENAIYEDLPEAKRDPEQGY